MSAVPKLHRTLLDIHGDFQALDDLVAELDGDISDPRVAQIIDEFWSELSTDLKTKVDNYAAYVTELNGRAHVRKDEAERLMRRAKVDETLARFLHGRLKDVLQARGIKKLETDRYQVSVRGNGGKQPLDIHDPANVPHEFCRHVDRWEPDSELIREALLAGKSVPGAALMERGTHLHIG